MDSDGHWAIRGARISPLPPEPVEVWIGAMAEPAIDRAARLGDGWLASPGLPPDGAAQQLRLYRERCAAHGKPVGTAAIRRDVYVGANTRDAAEIGGRVVAAGYRGFPAGATIVGDADEVVEAFRALADQGYSDVIVRNLVADQKAALQSIERLAVVRERVAAP